MHHACRFLRGGNANRLLSSLVCQLSFNTHTGRSPRQSTFPAAGSSARSTPPSSFRYRCDQHPRHPTTDLVAISAPPWPRPHSPSSPHPTLTAQLPRRLSRYHLTGSGVGPPTAGTAARDTTQAEASQPLNNGDCRLCAPAVRQRRAHLQIGRRPQTLPIRG